MIWKDQWVKIEKIDSSDNPFYPTPKSEDYVEGRFNPGVSIPKNYVVRGKLIKDPELWYCLGVVRTERNGHKASGIFSTSRVKKYHELEQEDGSPLLVIETENSIYWITKDPEAEQQYGNEGSSIRNDSVE